MKENLTFEEAITRLEYIIAKFDSVSVSLEDSLALYEEGAALSTYCSKKLEHAEQRITELEESLSANEQK